jgi:hypothetical protein|tara:strand:- start:313 stop:537 length:225 start_codon:yes stop_codon:yes gene_type:complete
MSRELNAKQKALIISEVKRNKSRGYENPYKISTDTYFKCMKLNDHETYYQNVENYLEELSWNRIADEYVIDRGN